MAKETAEQKLLKIMNKAGASSVNSSGQKKFNFTFSMQTLNQLLLAGIVVCVLVLGYELYKGINLLKTDVDLSGDVKAPTLASIALPTSKDVKFYLDKVNSRNIFRPYDGQVKSAAPTAKGLAVRMGKYKLVGIAWLDLPETASIMIEDTENKTTYFLKQGEQLDDVTVKTIYTDRVVFSDENEETIIKL
jgi:hypothetical protein